MVNPGVTVAAPAFRVVLAHAPAHARAGLAALFALDETLGTVLRTTRQPMIGQMRLTWWHAALTALDGAPPPANPVLEALARDVLGDVPGATLATMVDGWEALLDEPVDAAAMRRFAQARGGVLFAAAAAVLRSDADVAAAGAAWALADLADNLGDAGAAAEARAMARPALDAAMRTRWPRRVRALGVPVLLARSGARTRAGGLLELLWYRSTGRGLAG